MPTTIKAADLIDAGSWAAAQPTMAWLVIGGGGFIVGWVLQFIGHAWQSRPAAARTHAGRRS